MATDPAVNVRELRNHGGRVLDRVERGETISVVRNGMPVAELRPLGGSSLTARELITRARLLPAVDPAELRRDIDAVVDQSL